MGLIKIKKGLNVPINGEPEKVIEKGVPVKNVALLGADYPGLKPTLVVNVGDEVKRGQLLFTDKKMPGVKYTSPAGGRVIAIHRGEKRVFTSLVIEIAGIEEEIQFPAYTGEELARLDRETIQANLVESGLWTAFRARPFGKVANPASTPHSIFITAMDTNPLAPPVEKILAGKETGFINGLALISRLTPGMLYLCQAPGTRIPTVDLKNLRVEEFAGPHPAGLPGTHIHFLDPVYREKTVWHIDAQDVVAIGTLFLTGRLAVERIISLAGPVVKKPRLLQTRLGASTEELTASELDERDESIELNQANETNQAANRVISGPVLSGRTATGPQAFLGRYHQQISALAEGRKRRFLGWLSPGLNLFSIKPILLSHFFPGKKFNFTTDKNGGKRAIVPIGSYEKIMPLDLEITYLLRSLMVEDIENAENLGCLELIEEDLGLCSFVSPAKIEYGPVLRQNLTLIEKES